MSGNETKDELNSPATGKKKSENRLWNGIKSTLPVNRIFPKKQASSLLLSTDSISIADDSVMSKDDDQKLSPGLTIKPKRHDLRSRAVSVSASTGSIRKHIQAIEPSPARKRVQFGLTPTELHLRYPDEPVPGIVVDSVAIIQQDILKEGIFRIPGRMTNILEMKISYEQGNGLGPDPDTHSVAGLVCQFFRELPEPILSYRLYPLWINAAKKPEAELASEIKYLTLQLPIENQYVLKFFIGFLRQVDLASGANRMSAKNLGLVFGASFLNPRDNEQYELENIKLQCTIIETMINYYDYIFEDDNRDCPTPTPRSKSRFAVPTIPVQSNNPL